MKDIIEIKQSMEDGMTVELDIPSGDFEGVYHCTFKGFEPGKLNISLPVRQGETVHIKTGDKVQISFLTDNRFYAFTSAVLGISGHGYLTIADPEKISELGLRENVGVGADLPLKFHAADGEAFNGQVLDISLNGLSFAAPCSFLTDTSLRASFSLPKSDGGSAKIEVDINVSKSQRVFMKGSELCKVSAKYENIPLESERIILDYITHKLESGRKTKFGQRTTNPAAQDIMVLAAKENILTVWDRSERMQPPCGFGELGICCRNCIQGPCRIDPFGGGATVGICGVGANVIVARNLLRMIAAGTAAHAEHARHLVHILLEGINDYAVKDHEKMGNVALNLNVKNPSDMAKSVGKLAMEGLSGFGYKENPWVSCIPEKRKDVLRSVGIMPLAVDTMVTESMNRTTMGVDANAENLLLAGLKCSMADYAALKISTDVADILFGTPKPSVSKAGFGVLKKDAVNVAVHGHNPMLAEAVCDAAERMKGEAIKAGAREGINVVGICCTGNEVLMRRGVPLASNYLSQELVIITGALDAVVADYQCVMPSIGTVADCFQTKVITTMEISKLEPSKNVKHIPFKPEDARNTAEIILREAISSFSKRSAVNIPQIEKTVVAGFSAESIAQAFYFLSPEDPLQPLVDNIVNGNIYGIALLCGCNNVNVPQDKNIVMLTTELIKNNILVLATGCAAGALACAGLMDPKAAEQAGQKINGVLTAVGRAAGVSAIPPALHMGSCVDNSRAVELAAALAEKLGVDINDLPLVASAPELMSEKSIAIGTAAVALGIPVHLGVIPPIQGSERIVDILTTGIKTFTGGYFIAEPNPILASEKLISIIAQKRQALGI